MTTSTSGKSATMTGGERGAKLLQSVREMTAVKALHISARTLQEWEHGHRQSSGTAQALIRISFRQPEVIAETLR